MKSFIVPSHLNILRDSIYQVSQYMEMTWYNERLHILRDSIYWRQNLKSEKKQDFVLNTMNLSIYKVSYCIKSSQYIERFKISSLSMYWWLDTKRDFIYWEIQCIEDKIFLFFSFQILFSIHWISQYIERFDVSNLLLYEVISMYQKISTLNLPPTVNVARTNERTTTTTTTTPIRQDLYYKL